MLHDAAICLSALYLCAGAALGASAEQLAAEQELLHSLEIRPEQLKPLMLETTIVEDGQARAIICYADAPAWREAATVIQSAIRAATGCELPMMTDAELSFEDADASNLILLGHLDNNRHVARLYHNFFVCLDVGYTGREGYVIRSVHDPWGAGHNAIVVGGSFPEGTRRAAAAFAAIVADAAQGTSLTLGRQLVLEFDPTDRQEPTRKPMTPEERDAAIERGRELMFAPGQGRSGVNMLMHHGIYFHRTGDPLEGEVYRALMEALWEYNSTDEYIVKEGLARYDRDFRDAWTFQVAVLWDLHEESGLFNDEERLRYTNLVLKLMLECDLYQGYERYLEDWRENQTIVHNHNTFPALAAYFVGKYFQRHYGDIAGPLPARAQMWLEVADGVFRGQRHSPKPLEDAASYQWLPITHTITYSLANGDTTIFDEGHALEAFRVAMMVTDNAGYQSAFGDHSAYLAASGISGMLVPIAWYHHDGRVVWLLEKVGGRSGASLWEHPLAQPYYVDVAPTPPEEHVGLTVARLPRLAYDYTSHSPQYPTEPNLPYEDTFDKLTFRDGLDRTDAYLLLDGFGRGTHMHFDANAIIRYADGGQPLLVDGEYIKNAPKYHSSLVIIRDGRSELTPAVTGLGAAVELPGWDFSRTWLTEYNGAEWTRRIVWRRGGYVLVDDRVEALQPGEFTLRCCWRPWGEATLEDNTLTVSHPPMTMRIVNADGAPARLEFMKMAHNLPVQRLSQQVGLTLAAGEAYRFVNLIYSHPQEEQRKVAVRRVGDGLVVVEGPEGTDVIALGSEGLAAAGIDGDAEMVVLGENSIVIAGATEVALEGRQLLKSSAPVSVEVDIASGRAVLSLDEYHRPEAEVRVSLFDGDEFTIAGNVDDRKVVELDARAVPEALAQVRERTLAMPELPASAGDGAVSAPKLAEAWQIEGFDPPLETLPVASVSADKEHYGRYGPVDKLVDGGFSSSLTSVQWPAGETVTITIELVAETEISSVVLREWHMSDSWDIGERRLAISSDGFQDDVREITAPFEEVGTQRWGGNVNTLVEVPVHQSARWLRLTVSPAREDSSVYLAEVQIMGTRPGAVPDITAMTTGDLSGDGVDEVVVSSGAGEIAAFSAAGSNLWTVTLDGRPRINALACADFNGDGRIEVAVGADQAVLALLSADGRVLWTVEPPMFRGIDSDVKTIVPADVDGDGTPEIVAGCKSWQYFAYDGTGQMVWKNVIYAHSATVGYADDFDGDGLPEIVGGNAYYTLNLIDDDGTRIYNRNRLGPEQTAVGSADVDGDGLPEILMGTDLGELICYDGDGSELWQANVGDRATRILTIDLNGDGVEEIVCAAESANVYAFTASGALIWRTTLRDGVTDLVLLPGEAPRFAAAAGTTGVVLLDAQGNVIARGAVEGRAHLLAAIGARIATTTDHGRVVAFEFAG